MIQCITPFETYQEGNLLIACLYLMRDYQGTSVVTALANSSLFVQVHGHVFINRRWFNLDLSKIIRKPERQIYADQVHSYPIDPRKDHSGYTRCFFASSKVPIAAAPLIDQGVILECELPYGLIPSYKGRAMNVSYYITLTIQGSSARTKSFHYPINIAGTSQGQSGHGNILNQCYTIKHCSLVGFPLTSIPTEFFASADLNYSTESITLSSTSTSENEEDSLQSVDGHRKVVPTFFHDLASLSVPAQPQKCFTTDPSTISCKISDQSHICTIFIGYGKGHVGKVLPILLDFSEKIQTCYHVKITLILIEKRFDDVLIQEKVIGSVKKATKDAFELHANILIPHDVPSSFQSHFAKVEYKLQFDFALSMPTRVFNAAKSDFEIVDPMAIEDEPLSFHIPLSMIYVMSPKNMLSTAFDDQLQMVFTKQQLISICLENRVFKLPLSDDVVNPDPLL